MRRITSFALAVALALAADVLPAGAQANGVAGTWRVTWDSGVRTEGTRVLEVTRRSTATLVLELRGDSLAGTWTMDQEPERHVPVRGVLRGDSLMFVSAPWGMAVGGGEMPVHITGSGRARDGRLQGTLRLHLPGREPPLRRWEAVSAGG